MGLPRFFQADDLFPGQEKLLQPDVARHVVKALRLSTNDALILFNGKGGEYQACISEIEKDKVWVYIRDYIAKEIESPLNIELGQGVSRGDRMDYTIQKAVELGVTMITPLLTDYCSVHLSEARWQNRLRHWQAIAISACEQSGRNRIPTIKMPLKLSAWLVQLTTDLHLILHPSVKANALSFSSQSPAAISLLIGPEGGFSQAELDLALQHRFKLWSLGKRILRTETAAVAALAILQYQWGDLGGVKPL